jgi:hypothetical protein
VAVQVRVTEYSCGQAPDVITSAKVGVTAPAHASSAVGVVNDGEEGHAIVEGPGSAEITGAVLSSTLIVWLFVDEFPQGSVAVQVRVFEYSCGQVPGVVTSANVGVTDPAHASSAVGVVNDGAEGHSIVDGPGKAEITGAMLSITVITCWQLAVMPTASVAVQVRVIVFAWGQLPGVWVSVCVIVIGGQFPVAVAVPVLDGSVD